MTLFAYIDENIERVKYETRIGIMPCALIKHYQIYRMYSLNRLNGMSANDAIFNVCESFSVDRSWVYRIINKMESEI